MVNGVSEAMSEFLLCHFAFRVILSQFSVEGLNEDVIDHFKGIVADRVLPEEMIKQVIILAEGALWIRSRTQTQTQCYKIDFARRTQKGGRSLCGLCSSCQYFVTVTKYDPDHLTTLKTHLLAHGLHLLQKMHVYCRI